jgi:hypothetical protein
MGPKPEWAPRPQASPLDDDEAFQALRQAIINGSIRTQEQAGLYINEVDDGRRLGAKNPARMVRDTLIRFLKENKLEGSYSITCRRTAEDGMWGVWVTRTA